MKETGKKICPLLALVASSEIKFSPYCIGEECAWWCKGNGVNPSKESGCALLLTAQGVQSMDKSGIYVEITND